MKIDETNVPEEPGRFSELCEKIGLALMLGQKVQFALSYYYCVFQVTHGHSTKGEAKKQLDSHLCKPMGVVVKSIETNAPLSCDLFSLVLTFKEKRNWLVHDFDQEATPFLARGKSYDYYISEMERIAERACTIMKRLDLVGKDLESVGMQR